MTSYYKIPRDSETGRKFEALFTRCKEVREKIYALGAKYGFEDHFHHGWNAAGGVSAVVFPENKEVDAKVWKDGGCGYRTFAPRLKGEGKMIREELNACGEVPRTEFNQVMGVKGGLHNIGVQTVEEFYAVALEPNWTDGVPADAIEIMGSEYEKLCSEEGKP